MGNKCDIKCLDSILSYSTVKMVTIKDFRLGLVHKFIQGVVFIYFIVYVLIISQEYLDKESSFGEALVKVHGVAPNMITTYDGRGVMRSMDDATGLVVPPNEKSAIFITINYEETVDQVVKHNCHYPKKLKGGGCTTDANCTGMDGTKRIALMTDPGICDLTEQKGFCMYTLWCPQEDPQNVLKGNNTVINNLDSRNFTIWIKASILFSRLKPKTVYSTIQAPAPITKEENPSFYNLLKLEEILNLAGMTYEDLYDHVTHPGAPLGAILGLTIDWSCDLNAWRTIESACVVSYSAIRLDNPDPNSAPGYNFRDTEWDHDEVTKETKRTVRKYYGVRVLMTSNGIGYQLSVMQIILQFSSFTALLVVATSVCDILLQYVVTGDRNAYSHFKNTETKSWIESKMKKKKQSINDDDKEDSITRVYDETESLVQNEDV